MAIWPSILPAGWLVGSPLAIRSGVSRIQMLSGHVRQRQAVVSPFDTFEITFNFNDVEFRLFEHFVRIDVNQGDWFTGPYHDGAGQQTGTIRFVDGAYSAQHQPDTGHWSITAQIEIDGRK